MCPLDEFDIHYIPIYVLNCQILMSHETHSANHIHCITKYQYNISILHLFNDHHIILYRQKIMISIT